MDLSTNCSMKVFQDHRAHEVPPEYKVQLARRVSPVFRAPKVIAVPPAHVVLPALKGNLLLAPQDLLDLPVQ